MLQKVRDNMKGTLVASVVFLLFIVPLVLTGVGDGSFLGSAVGTNAAEVNGKKISEAELRRAIFMQRQRMLDQQGVDPTAEFLKEENLRGPVLDNLTRRAALVTSAQEGGMGISSESLDRQIVEQPEFQVGGVFDQQTYRRLLANLGFTPTTYRQALGEDALISQLNQGIALSAFSTEREIQKLVSLIQQRRSFSTVKIPVAKVSDSVGVDDAEILGYYEENKNNFTDEEKITVEYVELSVDRIAEDVEIAEEDVRKQYDSETAEFEKSQEYEIAHILIESGDEQQSKVETVSKRLKGGADFGELVLEFSDDSGSKENGGYLGAMLPDVFPKPFEDAVYALDEGEVSEPVETDAGVHFISVVSKTVTEAPTFEARKPAIENALKRAQAEEIYAENLNRLGELTFSATDLSDASSGLSLPINTTEFFTRSQGSGLAMNTAFRDAAFSEDVLINGYNSNVVELSDTQVVVLKKASHEPERIKSIEEVKDEIVGILEARKIDEQLVELSDELKERLASGEEAKLVAEELDYEFKSLDKVERTNGDVDFQVASKAFSMGLGENGASYDVLVDREGNHIVITLNEIVPGEPDDIAEQQLRGLTAQLNIQNAGYETAMLEDLVFSNADIDM